MTENDYISRLKGALDLRKDWFDKTALPKLREDFCLFHENVSKLYNLFVNKGLIVDDPYKNESKADNLTIPPTEAFNDSNKRDQIGMRFSALDNELSFLVNSYSFNTDTLTQDKVKLLIGIVKYIDWLHLTPDGINVMTQAVSEIVSNIRHGLSDPVTTKMLTESISVLNDATKTIINTLKLLNDYNREVYKYDVRVNITASMSAEEATLQNINKKFKQTMTGKQFYAELIKEIIKEDYSPDSKSLQESILQQLATEMGITQKQEKKAEDFKRYLVEAINCIGSCGTNLSEIIMKVKVNYDILEQQKSGLLEFIKRLIAQITNKADEPTIYDLEYIDPVKGILTREKLNYDSFVVIVEKKILILGAMSPRGGASKKIENMDEGQMIDLLQRNIKDVQNFHKTLVGLDEYFKTASDKAVRVKIKGIKPELSALKNTLTKANEKFQDYNAKKEEDEQFKKLGIGIAN
jgi:hypothetical protein